MRVLILGATGGTGSWLVRDALARGHDVTAFVRRETPHLDNAARVRTVIGDVLEIKSVQAAVRDHEAVIWAIGARATDSARSLCWEGTKNVLRAMKMAGVRRFICESAFGVGDSRRGDAYARILRIVIWTHVRDKEMQERSILETPLDWVIVRPTILTNGPPTGMYRVGTDLRVGLFPRISRADVADFMLRQLEEQTFVRKAVSITG